MPLQDCYDKTCLINITFYPAAYLTSGASSSASTTTKILYYTNRSATPFMSSVPKQIGDVTLRDFKNLFDRPGFFRFHFKSVDQEFGMVKEEVSPQRRFIVTVPMDNPTLNLRLHRSQKTIPFCQEQTEKLLHGSTKTKRRRSCFTHYCDIIF